MYAHELPRLRARAIASSAKTSRPVAEGPPTNEAQEKRQQTLREGRVLVRGRFLPSGAEVWDVIKLEGNRSELYAAGIPFLGEAAELAGCCMRGRTFVSVGQARALLRPSGGLLLPTRGVEPLSSSPRLTPVAGQPRTFVASPRK